MVTLDDCLEAEDICKADPSFQKLMRERYDISDLATVACDPWYYGGRSSKSSHLQAHKPGMPLSLSHANKLEVASDMVISQ